MIKLFKSPIHQKTGDFIKSKLQNTLVIFVICALLAGTSSIIQTTKSFAYEYDKTNFIVAASLKYLNQPMDCYALVMHALADAGYPSSGQSSPGVPWVKYQNYGHQVSRNEMKAGDVLYFPPPLQHWAIYAGNGITINGGYLGYVKEAPLSTVEGWNGPVKEIWRMNGNDKPKEKTLPGTPFTDVTEENAHADNIVWLYKSGITTGVSADKFGPTRYVSRGAMASFFYRLAGNPGRGNPNIYRFDDVNKSTPHYEDILWMDTMNLTSGCNGGHDYCPFNPVSRGSMATFLYNLAGKPNKYLTESDYSRFNDLGNNIHKENIIWLAKMGVTTGYGNNIYRPEVIVTRQQMASFLKRFYENVGVNIYNSNSSADYDPSDENNNMIIADNKVIEIPIFR